MTGPTDIRTDETVPPGAASLAATRFVDADNPRVQAFAAEHAGEGTDLERAVRLYYAVRDGIRYDPYRITLTAEGLRGSSCLENGYGFCITKAAFLAAVARAAGIPARLGFADVRNHLATPRLLELMKTETFYYHGYVSLWLEGRWVKATPAFNIELCERFGVVPLEFDGRNDSIMHPFDTAGRRHMEYLDEHGLFEDLPYETIVETFRTHYPVLVAGHVPQGDFHAEAAAARQG